jgi:hypothetical protein
VVILASLQFLRDCMGDPGQDDSRGYRITEAVLASLVPVVQGLH